MKFRADGMLRTCHTDEHALRLQCRHDAVLVLRVNSRKPIHLICLRLILPDSISPCAPRTHVRSSPAMQQPTSRKQHQRLTFIAKRDPNPKLALIRFSHLV